MVPWVSDARLVFLVWFVSIAVVVAGLLIFAEIKFKRKKKHEATRKREKTPIERMKIILNRKGDVNRKFEIVGKTAKNYFQEEHGMANKLDYSELAKRFERSGKVLETEFCKKMFELHYSNKRVTEGRVEELGDLLVEMGRKKKVSKDMSKVPSVWERIDRFFGDIKKVVVSRFRARAASFNEKVDRDARTKSREDYELLSWVRKAIRMGHSKEMLSGLLKDGGKSGGEIKKILKIYDREIAVVSDKKTSARFYDGEEGVAQRLIQKEKSRLEKMEVLSA